MIFAGNVQWDDCGNVFLGEKDDLLHFPKLYPLPVVYLFRLDDGEKTEVYIGETENMKRRVAHYRNPGPSQKTNIYLNKIMKKYLQSGGRITIHLMTFIKVEIDGKIIGGLDDKFVRRLLENAAILHAIQQGDQLLNM